MADRFSAKWPVAELSAVGMTNGRSYLSAKEVAGLYDMKYSTFMKRLKDFVQFGVYPPVAFRVGRRLGSRKRDYWLIEIHPVLGIRALNRHFYPRLAVQ
jgi:hypothetical protein